MAELIYLDNGATTMKKPPRVSAAVNDWMECGNPGRGSHRAALAASEKIYEARSALASFFGASAERVIFTYNATYALNMAIKGSVKEDSTVITSDFEHNSVRRPVIDVCQKCRCVKKTFSTYSADEALYNLERAIDNKTSMVICVHKSNITGRTMPIRQIGEICRKRGILFIVDASQSAGNTKIDMVRDNIDILCAAGHKGLYGPQGTGVMALGEDVKLKPLVEGGSGSDSMAEEMPSHFPDRMEGGTLSTPLIAGLLEGVRFVRETGEEKIGEHERQLWRRGANGIISRRVIVYDRSIPGANLLFNVRGMSASYVSAELDKMGICTRAGFHCAPDAHCSLITTANGAVRASFSYFTKEDEVEQLVRAVRKIAYKDL